MFNQNPPVMIVRTHAIHFHPQQKLIQFLQDHLDKLETFYNHFQKSEVYLRVNNEPLNSKTVEIRLDLPGMQLFASRKAESFEAAIVGATDSLKSQLKKFKNKIVKKHHRG